MQRPGIASCFKARVSLHSCTLCQILILAEAAGVSIKRCHADPAFRRLNWKEEMASREGNPREHGKHHLSYAGEILPGMNHGL